MKKSLGFLTACLVAALRAEPAAPAVVAAPVAEAPQFIRVEEKGKNTELQTAVVRFRKGDASVELVGAIHIADRKYYEELNERFVGYDAVLYEGIGGSGKPAAKGEALPHERKVQDPPPADEGGGPAPKKKNLDGLHGVYDSAARWLELSYQMKEIDYRKPNFVHADLTMEEFSALQTERKESLVGFMLKTGFQANQKPAVKEPSSIRLLTSIIKKDKNGLKRELVHTLGAGDDQVAGLTGDNVIIGDRNAKCLEVLDSEVALGKQKLCVFYGAAHFPDMERRLLEDGWTKEGTDWLTAWEIGS